MGTDQTGPGRTQAPGSIDFELLVESAADVLLQADVTGAIAWASLGAAALAVTNPAALTGQACASLVHPEDRAGFAVALRAASADGRARTDVRMGSPAAGWGWHSVVIRRMALAAGLPGDPLSHVWTRVQKERGTSTSAPAQIWAC